MSTPASRSATSETLAAIDVLWGVLRGSNAVHLNSTRVRDQAKELVQQYFRSSRPELLRAGITEEALAPTDAKMQDLLRLSHGRNRRTSYVSLLSAARRTLREMDVEREIAAATVSIEPQGRSRTETRIIETLAALVPTAALSYEQALQDLNDPSRVSFRGTANELRSVVWDVLDRLAPDDLVMAGPGFKLEQDRTKPTQRQKVRYILRSRGVPESARKAPEAAVTVVDEQVALLTRATYDRSSISAHVATSKGEVQNLKMYVDTVLSELLLIHS